MPNPAYSNIFDDISLDASGWLRDAKTAWDDAMQGDTPELWAEAIRLCGIARQSADHAAAMAKLLEIGESAQERWLARSRMWRGREEEAKRRFRGARPLDKNERLAMQELRLLLDPGQIAHLESADVIDAANEAREHTRRIVGLRASYPRSWHSLPLDLRRNESRVRKVRDELLSKEAS